MEPASYISSLSGGKWLLAAVVAALLLVVPLAIFSQPGLPSPPEQTPIDGGLAFLAAAGGAYGIKKLRDKNKE